MHPALSAYAAALSRELRQGNAREHAHRPALKTLLESLAHEAIGAPVTATNEPSATPRKTKPDFAVATDSGVLLGYVEAKDVGVALDAETEQLRRYRASLASLVFTDYLRFRWFVDGEERLSATLGTAGPDGEVEATDEGAAAVETLLRAFAQHTAPVVTTAEELARRMAALARLLEQQVVEVFEAEPNGTGPLHAQAIGFRQVLLPGLKDEEFADLYAQTLAYGLFAARAAVPGEAPGFSRATAFQHLPPTSAFLRNLFGQIAGFHLDPRVAWVADDLARLLARTDMAAILNGFARRRGFEDPVVHFYETFLAAYDPALRQSRGVYYTPEPVVSYLVRSVDALLRRDFGLADGLADDATVTVPVRGEDGEPQMRTVARVQVLDPATGTGTFLYGVVQQLRSAYEGNEGLLPGVARALVPRLHGFELLMAPYVIAHMKLGLALGDLGYTFDDGQRLGVYLTNALEEAAAVGLVPFGQFLADEANAAAAVKRDVPVMVVLGNPPYKGHSMNPSERPVRVRRGSRFVSGWTASPGGDAEPTYGTATDTRERPQPTHAGRLIRPYFFLDGQPLGERNPKWLNDDYVKFIAFAEDRIRRTGAGVLAFVTNHGYLDNPTFRGMRARLLRSFDRLYVLDLHGNANKQERTPEGEPDANVFDIRQGVALALFVRTAQHRDDEDAEVYHADLYGTRAQKYDALDAHDVTTTAWTRLAPERPFVRFRPVDRAMADEWRAAWALPDVFPVNNVGIVTARDALTIDFDRSTLWERVQRFAKLSVEKARQSYDLGVDARDWKVDLAQKDVRRSGPSEQRIVPILYRPFDVRWIYYTDTSRGFLCYPRADTMRHMIEGANIGMTWVRPMSPRYTFTVGVTEGLIDQCAIGNKSAGAGISYIGPLYLYPDPNAGLFAGVDEGPKANLAPAFLTALDAATGLRFVDAGPNEEPPVHLLAALHHSTGTVEVLGAEPDERTYGPRDVLAYAYAVFHSDAYRERFADFLATEFPRLPLPPSAHDFRDLARVGHALVALHLLRDDATGNGGLRFPVAGDNAVAPGYPKHVAEGDAPPGSAEPAPEGRVYLNPTQYVAPVAAETWAHEVGGYRVAEKWLKDRRGRALSLADVRHYQRTLAALAATPALAEAATRLTAAAFGWSDAADDPSDAPDAAPAVPTAPAA